MPSFNRFAFMMRCTLLLWLMLMTGSLVAQNDFIISGKFKVDGGSNSGAKIIVEKNGKQVKQLEGESRFEIGLDFQAIYVISFQKEGFVTKRLRFDTHVPEDRIEYGFEPFGFTVEIFEQYDDVSMVVFNQPVGRIAYSELIDEFDYDTDYTKSIQSQIDKAMEDVEVAKEKKAEKQAEVGKEVAKLTKEAESSAKSGNFDQAITALEKAQELQKDPAVEKRIKELQEAKQDAKKEAEFNDILADAEEAMANGDIDGAKRLLKQADGVISGDARVKQQLAQIEQEEKAKAQQAKAFDAAMDAGESALLSGDFETASAKAEEALKVRPNDSKAEQLLAASAKAKAEAEAKAAAEAEKDEAFNALMADAKKAQDKGNFDEALAKLEEAKTIKADPSIDEQMQAVKAAVAKLEEEKRKEAEAKAQLDGLIEEAQQALAAGDIDGAREKLAAAQALGDDERLKALAEGIEAEEKKLAEEAEAAQAKQAEIKALLESAEKALASGELDEAEKAFKAAADAGADAKRVADGIAQVDAKRTELAEAEAARQAEEEAKQAKLDGLIEEANQALASDNLDVARQKIQAAKALGEDARIDDLQKQVDERAKELAKSNEDVAKRQEKYNELIATGKEALAAKELDKAESAFEEAKVLVDDASEAENGLAEVKEIRDELASLQRQEEAKRAEEEAAAKQQAAFDDAIAEANKAFEKEKWEEAKAKFNEALAIKDDEAARQQIAAIDAKLEELAAAEAAAEGAELAALEAERKAREEEAARKAAEEEAARKAAEEEATRQAAEEEAARKAAEEEAARQAAEEEAARKAAEEEAAKKAAEEVARTEQGPAPDPEAAAAEEAARKAREEEAARKAAEEAAAKRLAQIESKRSDAEAYLKANQLNRAQTAYEEVLALAPGDADASKKLEQITALKQKLAEQKAATENAAVAITDQRGRESEQLAEIIEQESVNQGAQEITNEDEQEAEVASPTVDVAPSPGSFAKAEMVQDVRPGAPEGPIIISNEKVGEEALQTKTAQMTEDDKFDGMMQRTEAQQQEFYQDEAQRALMEKYTSRKTVEIDTVGNSVVTKVFINTGEFVKIFKKVEHNWGGVYYFVDEQATNRRFWEHETQ